MFLAISRARYISQFKYPPEPWKRGFPVLGHNTVVSKTPIKAISTNPGEKKGAGCVCVCKGVRRGLLFLPKKIERVYRQNQHPSLLYTYVVNLCLSFQHSISNSQIK